MNRNIILSAFLLLSTSTIAVCSNDDRSQRNYDLPQEEQPVKKKNKFNQITSETLSDYDPVVGTMGYQANGKREREEQSPQQQDAAEPQKKAKDLTQSLDRNKIYTPDQIDNFVIYYSKKAVAGDHVALSKLVNIANKHNHPVARYQIGVIYADKKDFKTAIKWLKLSASQGHADAMVMAGKVSLDLKNYIDAHAYFKSAVQKAPSAEAYFCLAYMYHGGLGMPKNMGDAARNYEEAANLGSIPAKYELAKLKLVQTNSLEKNLEGLVLLESVCKDYQSDISPQRPIQKAARNEIDQERFDLGQKLLKQKRTDEALALFKKAARSHPQARFSYAQLLLKESLTLQTLNEAEAYLKLDKNNSPQLRALFATISSKKVHLQVEQLEAQLSKAQTADETLQLLNKAAALRDSPESKDHGKVLNELVARMAFETGIALTKGEASNWEEALKMFEIARDENHPQAQLHISKTQYGWAKDIFATNNKNVIAMEKAIQLLNESSKAGNEEAKNFLPQAYLTWGKQLWNCPSAVYKRKEKSIEALSEAAKTLDNAKQTRDVLQMELARLYLTGEAGCPQKTDRALYHFETCYNNGVEAAKSGYSKALTKSALDDLDNNNSSLQPQAKNMLEKAAKLGDAEAAFALGKILYKGHAGAKRNWPYALMWLDQAVENGYQDAKELLAEVQYHHATALLGKPTKKNMTLSNPDFTNAIDLLKKSNAGGFELAQDALANAYFIFATYLFSGKAEKRDFSLALKMYEQAAELGNAKAMHKLGLMYLYGEEDVDTPSCVPINLENAVDYLSAADEVGVGKKLDLYRAKLALAQKGYSEGNAHLSIENLVVLSRSKLPEIKQGATDLLRKIDDQRDAQILERMYKDDPLKCLNFALQMEGSVAKTYVRKIVDYNHRVQGQSFINVDGFDDNLQPTPLGFYGSLDVFLNTLRAGIKSLEGTPILVDCLTLKPVPADQNHDSENVRVDFIGGQSYLTVGAENMKQAADLKRMISHGCSIQLPQNLLSAVGEFILTTHQLSYVTDEQVKTNLKEIPTPNLPTISNIDEARVVLDFVQSATLHAKTLLQGQRMAMSMLSDELASEKSKQVSIYDQSEQSLNQQDEWLKQTRTLLRGLEKEVNDLIVNSESRNRSVISDETYAPIMRAFASDESDN